LTDQRLEKLGVLSVDDYVRTVTDVWKEIHPRRTVVDYTLHVLDHASKLGEAIRRDDADLILRETAETTNWLFGLVAKLNDDKTGWQKGFNISTKFSRMIWDKYPNLCPHCFHRIYVLNKGKKAAEDIVADIKGKCKYCLSDYPRVEERSTEQKSELNQLYEGELRRYAQKTLKKIPGSLQEMEAMFHSIYGSNTALATLESIGFHILEEAGEMGRAVIDIYTDKSSNGLLENEQQNLCNEIAEVFSWLCSLTLKVRAGAKTFDKYRNKLVSYALPGEGVEELAKDVELEKILWITYRNRENKQYECRYCRKSICTCKLKFAWEKQTY
jgi:NTP pyrophosphatase (non-canonical NTP hydrolase)